MRYCTARRWEDSIAEAHSRVRQAVLLLAWLNLGPDASATSYTSVQSLLDWIGASQPQERAYMVLASLAIRGSSRNIHILGAVVLATSLMVIVLAIMIGIQLRRIAVQKTDASKNA